jgi:hypothetical protein
MVRNVVYHVSALKWPYGYFTNLSNGSYYSIAVCDSAAGVVAVDSESYDAALDPYNPSVYGPYCSKRTSAEVSGGVQALMKTRVKSSSSSNVRPQAYTASGFERLGACSSVSSNAPNVYYHDAEVSESFIPGAKIFTSDS